MKTIIYKLEVNRNNDSFDYWFFNLADAKKEAKNIINHLTEKEKLVSEITLTTYAISLHNYTKTADQLILDLFNEEIVIPEYDPMLASFNDFSIVLIENLL